jgi:hypothetical protein
VLAAAATAAAAAAGGCRGLLPNKKSASRTPVADGLRAGCWLLAAAAAAAAGAAAAAAAVTTAGIVGVTSGCAGGSWLGGSWLGGGAPRPNNGAGAVLCGARGAACEPPAGSAAACPSSASCWCVCCAFESACCCCVCCRLTCAGCPAPLAPITC